MLSPDSEQKPNFAITPAQPDDVEAIERMRYQSWLDTYPNEELGFTEEMVKERFASRLTPEGLAKTRQRYEDNLDNQDVLQLVAKDNSGQVVGAIIATNGARGREIGALYTDKSVHGTGVGGALMSQALNWLGDDEDVLLNVASYNERAIHFYEKFGFAKVGEPFVDEQFPNMPEQKMARRAKS